MDRQSSLGRRYFSRPPLRSYYFWVSTISVFIVISEAVFFVVRLRMRLNGEALSLMIFSVAVLVVLWSRLLISHRAVHKVYCEVLAARLDQDDPSLATVLDTLAYLSYAGLGLALLALSSVYMALVWSVSAGGWPTPF